MLGIKIYHDGNEITNKVVTYDRTWSICTGVASFTFSIEMKTDYTVDLWDVIELYEGNIKKNKFYVFDSGKQIETGLVTFNCQDGSKLLSEYFVTDTYEIPDFSYSRTWLETFLELAGVSYTFDTASSGVLISNDTTYGKSYAYEIIMQLLQMSGWYMYFDGDGICHIGSISTDLTNPVDSFQDNEILSLRINTDDKMLRNRAIVWGRSDENEKVWVHSDIYQPTQWDTSAYDKRAVVLANSNIRSMSVARNLAQQLLDTFNEVTVVKTVELEGAWDIVIGDVVLIDSERYTGIGMVTTLMSSVSAQNGLRTTVVLDEKCPRLFAYFGYTIPVYIGTYEDGIWKKNLDESIWYDFSTGLDFPYTQVKDLIIKNGVFAAVMGDYAYVNIGHDTPNWKKYTHPFLTDQEDRVFATSGVEAVACDIDVTTGNIFIGYKLKDIIAEAFGESRSWVVEITPKLRLKSTWQIVTTGNKEDFKLVDVERSGGKSLATAVAPANYMEDDLWGIRKVYELDDPDADSTCFGLLPSETEITDAFVNAGWGSYGNYYGDGHMIIEGQKCSIFGSKGSFNYIYFEEDTPVTVSRTISWPYEYGNARVPGELWQHSRMVYRKATSDRYNIVDIIRETNGYDFSLYHFTMTPFLDPYPDQVPDVRCATTANITRFGLQTIDGYVLSAGDRVLVKNQTNKKQNGIYVVSAGNWLRASQLTGETTQYRTFVNVKFGDTNKDTSWQISTKGAIITNVTSITWKQVLVVEEVNKIESFVSVLDASILHDVMMRNGCVFILTSESALYESEVVYDYFITQYVMDSGAYTKTKIYSFTKERANIGGSYYTSAVTINSDTAKFSAADTGVFLSMIQTKSYVVTYNEETETYYLDNSKAEVRMINCFYKADGTQEVTETLLWQIPETKTVYEFKGSIWNFAFSNIKSACVGIQLIGNGIVDSILKIHFSVSYAVYYAASPPEYFEWLYVYIVSSSGEILLEEHTGRGQEFIGGTLIPFNNLDLEEYNFNFSQIMPFHGRENLKYLYQGYKVMDSLTPHTQIGTITGGGICSPVLDDFDGGIYTLSGNHFYKQDGAEESTTFVSVDVEELMDLPIYFGMLLFVNGLVIRQRSGFAGYEAWSIWKLKQDYIFKDQKLCFLAEKYSSTSVSYTAKLKDSDPFKFTLEESKASPLVGITQPESLMQFVFNEISYAYGYERAKIYGNNYTKIAISGQWNDSRIFDANNSIIPLAGEMTSNYSRYIGLADRTTLYQFLKVGDKTRNSLITYKDFVDVPNEQITHIETSNRYLSPYMFITMSGDSNVFYQKNAGTDVLLDYSLTLPASPVTLIRLDDLV